MLKNLPEGSVAESVDSVDAGSGDGPVETVGSGCGDASVVSDGWGSGDVSAIFVGPSAVTVVESEEDARETEIKLIAQSSFCCRVKFCQYEWALQINQNYLLPGFMVVAVAAVVVSPPNRKRSHSFYFWILLDQESIYLLEMNKLNILLPFCLETSILILFNMEASEMYITKNDMKIKSFRNISILK